MLSRKAYTYCALIVALVVTGVICGCTTRVQDVQQEPDVSLRNYEILTVQVYTQSQDVDPTLVQQMEQWIMSKLRERNLTKKSFKKIHSTASPVAHAPYVKMTVNFIELKKASSLQRFFGPPFAGEAAMIAEVQLSDGSSGKRLSQGTIGGKTTSGLNYMAVELAAEEIANFAIRR